MPNEPNRRERSSTPGREQLSDQPSGTSRVGRRLSSYRIQATGAALALGLAALGLDERLLAQSRALSPCDIRTSERVVAVGDVHGAYAQFAAILRAAVLIDGRDRWIGGRAILVQTGDVLDRGSDSRRALDLLRRLEREAAQARGRV